MSRKATGKTNFEYLDDDELLDLLKDSELPEEDKKYSRKEAIKRPSLLSRIFGSGKD